MTGTKGRLAKGALWVAAARVLINVVSFGTTLLLARLLTPADFGIVAIASTVTAVITSLTDLSLSSALVQHRDPQDDHFHGAWTLNLMRSGLLAALVCLLAAPTARIYGDPRLFSVLIVIGASTVLVGAVNPKLAVFSRNLIFWQDFAFGVSQRMVGFLVAIAVAVVYQSYWALICGIVATQLSAVVVSYLLFPYRPRFRLARARELLSFSIWLSLGQAINTLNWRADQLAIGYFLGNAALGYYTVGDNLAVLPTREATTPIAQTLFPGFSRMADDVGRLRAAYQRSQALLCAVALPAGVGFALIAEPLLLLTMGEKWLPALVVIQALAGVFALQTLASTLQPLAMAMGETRELFKRDLLNLVIRLPLILAGMALGGLAGIVYARCVSGLASTVINMIMVRRLLGLQLRRQLAVNVRALASVGVMVAATYGVGIVLGDPREELLLAGKIAAMTGTGALVYVLSSFALWAATGHPGGPESEIGRIVARLTRRPQAAT